MHHLAITSMTGGRNRGCEALVTSILLGLESVIPRGDLSIDLHTRDVDYDRDFFAGRVNKVLPARASRRVDKWSPELQRRWYALLKHGPARIAGRRISPSLGNADRIITTGGEDVTTTYIQAKRHGTTPQNANTA